MDDLSEVKKRLDNIEAVIKARHAEWIEPNKVDMMERVLRAIELLESRLGEVEVKGDEL